MSPQKLGRHRPLTDDTISTGPLAYSCTSTLDRSMGVSDVSKANPSVSATLASLCAGLLPLPHSCLPLQLDAAGNSDSPIERRCGVSCYYAVS